MDIVCFRDACDGDVPDNRPSPSGTLQSEREERDQEGIGKRREEGKGRGEVREAYKEGPFSQLHNSTPEYTNLSNTLRILISWQWTNLNLFEVVRSGTSGAKLCLLSAVAIPELIGNRYSLDASRPLPRVCLCLLSGRMPWCHELSSSRSW